MSPRSHLQSGKRTYGACQLFAVCTVALVTVAALAGPVPGPAATVEITVLENTPTRIVIQYNFEDFEETQVKVDGQTYSKISLSGEPSTLITGAPELPYLARSVTIRPDADNVTVNVDLSRSRFIDLRGKSVISSKGNLPRTIDPESVPYTFGPEYETDAFFPGKPAAAREPYTLRDLRGVAVLAYPFQYNPVTQTLRVYTTLTIEVVPEASGDVAAPASGFERELSLAFHQVYQAHFINYEPEERYPPLDEVGDLLIICHDVWIPNLQPLVAHKNSLGINTTLVSVSTIGNDATAIKNYIQNVYDTSDLAFVLLVGDGAQVDTPSASGGSSDPSYSKLTGGDDYPDIMVGRFSAETTAQVDTQVQRTIEYENMPATVQDWFWRATGIASNQGAGQGDEGQADNVHMDEIRDWLLAAGYTEVDQIYDPGATSAQVAAALNAGRGLVNYCGHGGTTSWSTSGFSNNDINALVNDNMLPFVHSVACVNGKFDGYTCFAETWLRATHNGEPTGAIGAYMSSINQSWAPPMEGQDEFNLLLTDPTEPYHAVGALCYAGACSMMDDYGSGGVNMFNTWHLFGDPSLRFVGMPTGLRVTPEDDFLSEGQEAGPFTPESMVYTLENLDATPMDYQVVKTAEWLEVDYESGTIPAQSSVQVTLSIGDAARALGNGRYQDTVLILNTTNHDGDTSREVTLRIGIPQPLYTWPLNEDPGWPRHGEWAFGQPTGQGGGSWGYPDPTSGATGANVFGVNLDGNYSLLPDGAHYLTLGPVDLTGVTEVSVRFQRWLNTDFQPWVSATIDASNDGGEWIEVWSNGGDEITDDSWKSMSYDLWDVADDQAAVWVRWGYRVIRVDAEAYSGWNIDDVEIWGLDANASPAVCPGDANCDGGITWRDVDYFVAAMDSESAWEAMFAPGSPSCPYANNDVNGDEAVSWRDIDPLVELMNTDCE